MASSGRDTYRPTYRNDGPPELPKDAAGAMYHFGQEKDRRRHDFSFRSRRGPKTASQRELLTTQPALERPLLGLHRGNDRFKNIEDLTDSDEADMDASSDEDEDEDEDRSLAKRVKLTQEDAPAVQKWSNPDPYTSLPPPTESSGKRKDVVKLIRKARNEAAGHDSDTLADQDDFISLGEIDDPDTRAPANAPSGPKATRSSEVEHTSVQKSRKRKRDVEDNIIGRSDRYFHADGMVLAKWRAQEGINVTPWFSLSDPTDTPIVALHREIVDFYGWVKPRDFEFDVRGDVMSRISRTLGTTEPGVLKAFGSYAAGLYLPTGDMDLVYITHQRYPNPPPKKLLYRISNYLERKGLARAESCLVIPSAKVPIIKFVEAKTGLKVDLSFNNESGVIAIDTFKTWQSAYPAMPIIVAVVKQFLMIRGLNDVSIGGLGGFSTICLVTSIIQHWPPGKPHNLGEILLEFFNVYGNLFNRERVGIRLDPPSYIDKQKHRLLKHANEKPDRLTIIDPNQPDNNVSGGSNEIGRIFNCFSKAHQHLQQRLSSYRADSAAANFSLLKDLVGGNFTAYDMQRDILLSLHHGVVKGPAPAIIPPPPPPIKEDPIPPPPSSINGVQDNAGSDEESGSNPSTQVNRKSIQRLARIKRCRPDLSKALVNISHISVDDALKVGGWKNGAMMDKALQKAEKKLATKGLQA